MATLQQDIEALRAIRNEWTSMSDPLAELRKIRHGYDPQGDPQNDTPDEARERALAESEKNL